MHYAFVQRIENRFVVTQPCGIVAWADANGCELTGAVLNPRLRRELQGPPKIEGLCGTMFDGFEGGAPVIRYEDQAAYDMLSN
jgi:hypothetical protein